MEEPLESTYAFCEVCESMCVGDFYKTERFLHHYICRTIGKDGVRHTFAILTTEGVTALKNEQSKEAKEALNVLKSQQRTKYAAQVLGVSAVVLFIKQGVEVLKKHDPHHHETGHTDPPDQDHGTGHDNLDSHTPTQGHSGGAGDSIGDVIETIADGLARFLRL